MNGLRHNLQFEHVQKPLYEDLPTGRLLLNDDDNVIYAIPDDESPPVEQFERLARLTPASLAVYVPVVSPAEQASLPHAHGLGAKQSSYFKAFDQIGCPTPYLANLAVFYAGNGAWQTISNHVADLWKQAPRQPECFSANCELTFRPEDPHNFLGKPRKSLLACFLEDGGVRYPMNDDEEGNLTRAFVQRQDILYSFYAAEMALAGGETLHRVERDFAFTDKLFACKAPGISWHDALPWRSMHPLLQFGVLRSLTTATIALYLPVVAYQSERQSFGPNAYPFEKCAERLGVAAGYTRPLAMAFCSRGWLPLDSDGDYFAQTESDGEKMPDRLLLSAGTEVRYFASIADVYALSGGIVKSVPSSKTITVKQQKFFLYRQIDSFLKRFELCARHQDLANVRAWADSFLRPERGYPRRLCDFEQMVKDAAQLALPRPSQAWEPAFHLGVTTNAEGQWWRPIQTALCAQDVFSDDFLGTSDYQHKFSDRKKMNRSFSSPRKRVLSLNDAKVALMHAEV